MNHSSIALAVLAMISGFCTLMLAIDTISYNYPPKGHVRWLKILFVGTLIFTMTAIVTIPNRTCSSYTQNDYKNGYVPVKCSTEEQLNKSKEG